LAAKLLGRRCIVEVGDPQATLYAAQDRSLAAVLAGRTIDLTVGAVADGVVLRGRGLVEAFALRCPWTVITDGVDAARFAPRDARGIRARLGFAADTLVVGVVGSITWSPHRSWCYGAEIVDTLGYLKEHNVRGLIVGDGSGLEPLRRRAAERGVADRVVFTGRVSHDEVPEMLAAMDVCVSTQTDDPIGRGRTTAKLPEYMAADRFILATRVGEAARLLPEEMLIDYGGTSDATYAPRLAARLLDFAIIPRSSRPPAGTRAIAMARFDYSSIVERWESFVLQVGVPN
jgi:glycosyltransferase involved in cell wall biosynthesis